VAKGVEEEGARQPVFETAGDVRRLVFEVQRNIEVVGPPRRQRIPQQMSVGAATGIGLDQPDRVVGPASWQAADRDLAAVGQRTDAVGCERLRLLSESRSPIGAAIN